MRGLYLLESEFTDESNWASWLTAARACVHSAGLADGAS
jgi:hypothetical protein